MHTTYYAELVYIYHPSQGYQSVWQYRLVFALGIQPQAGGPMFAVVYHKTGPGGALMECAFIVNGRIA